MDELNEVWAKMMQGAMLDAQTSGRTELAEYLAVKSANDVIRAAGCRWLFDSFLELSDQANRRGIKLEVESESPHRFSVGHSTMVGSLMRFTNGLRKLTIEAGWTRVPADGIIRGLGLARGRITHFGQNKYNAELLLSNHNLAAPQWFVLIDDDKRETVSANDLLDHFDLFIGTN